MPQLASYSLETVRTIFAEHGIVPLREYPDGQIMWGVKLEGMPYQGPFLIADFFKPGRYDIRTIQAIVDRCGRGANLEQIEAYLHEHILDGTGED